LAVAMPSKSKSPRDWRPASTGQKPHLMVELRESYSLENNISG
jgi:hypothetical protein